MTKKIDQFLRHWVIDRRIWNDFFIRGSFFKCRQLCLNSHGVLKVRTGHESIKQSQPCWALPHQAKGSNTDIRSSSGNTNEDTATVASSLGHGPSALNRAMTILHSISSDLPTTWISGISCTISRSCTVKVSHTVPCHAR